MDIKFRSGDTVVVYEKVKEGNKTRLVPFEGVVIAIRGSGINKSFTVRKIAVGGVGVERIWPVQCPSIEKVTIKRKGGAKRAKLYYLRKRVGKRALAVAEKETVKSSLGKTEGGLLTGQKENKKPPNNNEVKERQNVKTVPQ